MVNPEVVLAYIDAGSAGLVFQLIIGVAATSVLSVVIFWRRLAERVNNFIFRKNKNRADNL